MIRDATTWSFVRAVTRPALALASPDFLADIIDQARAAGIQYAVTNGDSTPIVDWMLGLIGLQGVSDQAAFAFDRKHGGVRSIDIECGLREPPSCSLLRCYWSFEACGYRKGARTCTEPSLLPDCPLPRHSLRKGGLNVAAYGLYLFVREVCGGDWIGWLDARLAKADPGVGNARRAEQMRDAIVGPLSCVPNTGPKIWAMILADMLLGSDPNRERWVSTGAHMIPVDSLVHSFFHRTGILRHCEAQHLYGDACYAPNGCAEIIGEFAGHIDARTFNPAFPIVFPRFVQHAIWQFCATGGRNICNGVQIDDRDRCQQSNCPAFPACDRVGR
jgi:hypothetical protein